MADNKESDKFNYTYWDNHAINNMKQANTTATTTTDSTIWVNGAGTSASPSSLGNYKINGWADKEVEVSNPIPATMDFHDGEKYVGTFKFKDGELTFEGDINDSAKILFQQFKEYVDKYIKDESFKVKLDSATE